MQALRLKEGPYRALLLLDVKQNLELPFNFDLKMQGKKPLITIHNADERIVVDEIFMRKDSLIIRLPVFDTELRVKVFADHWQGEWINHYRKDKNRIPFKAFPGQTHRFVSSGGPANSSLEGRWETLFKSADGKETPAIAQFHHNEQSHYIHGTFLTETGDYRYLDGLFENGRLQLSCFDGSHAFLFDAKMNAAGELEGVFYSGMHWQEKWLSRRNKNASLRKADSIAVALNTQEPVRFRFENTEGQMVSLSDSGFSNKVIILQVMGSWCPNCMDESRYLKQVYETYASRGLRIIALAFEKSSDPLVSRKQVLRMKERLGLPYPVLITAQSGKDQAAKSLPFLSTVYAFPTTVFLDRKHRVVKVHTGFNGPATGQAFTDFEKETEALIKTLLASD